MRVQGRKVNNRHDLFPEAAAGKVSGAEQRKPLYIAFIDQSKAFEPNQQEGVIHSLAEDGMPSQAPKEDNVFP